MAPLTTPFYQSWTKEKLIEEINKMEKEILFVTNARIVCLVSFTIIFILGLLII